MLKKLIAIIRPDQSAEQIFDAAKCEHEKRELKDRILFLSTEAGRLRDQLASQGQCTVTNLGGCVGYAMTGRKR